MLMRGGMKHIIHDLNVQFKKHFILQNHLTQSLKNIYEFTYSEGAKEWRHANGFYFLLPRLPLKPRTEL